MKVFQVWPKRTLSANGQVLTPEMTVTVSLKYHSVSPFSNGIRDVAEAYMRIYRCDIKRLCCNAGNFNYKGLA